MQIEPRSTPKLHFTVAFVTFCTYVQDWDFVERPQIMQDSDGKPLTLFLGQSYKDSHTLAMMFCQEGDTGCVTTVQ